MSKKELFKKTDTGKARGEIDKTIDRFSFTCERNTSRILETFVRAVRDETGWRISQSLIIEELIKLLPMLKINPFYLGSKQDVINQFEIIRNKIKEK